jgi:hypothetical protein
MVCKNDNYLVIVIYRIYHLIKQNWQLLILSHKENFGKK